jgi:glycosyltransferase involved in cell wall biosynthesis
MLICLLSHYNCNVSPRSKKQFSGLDRLSRKRSKESESETSSVLIVANMPPPTNGVSVVNSWVSEVIQEQGFVFKFIDTTARASSFLFIFSRIAKYVYASIIVSIKIDYQTLYLPLGHGFSLLPQASLVLIARLKGKRVLVHHHSYLPMSTRNKILLFLHARIFSRSEAIFLSAKMRDDYENRFTSSSKKWIVRNAGAACNRMSKVDKLNLYEDSDLIWLAHASNLSVEKGALVVIEVMSELLSRFERVSCNLLGPVENLQILEKIMILQQLYPGRFIHTGRYDSALLSNVLSQTDFFLFPSNYMNEASPIVVLEAQCAGVTVIASNAGTIESEILAPGCSVELNRWVETVTEKVEIMNSLPQERIVEYRRSSKLRMQGEMERLGIRSRADMITALSNGDQQ